MTSPQQSWGPGGHQGPPPPPRPPRNGLGVAALVCGLVALALFWTVIGGALLGLLALVFGVIGYGRKRKGEATNGLMALIGAVAGLVALVASALILALGVSLLNSDEFQNLEDCLRQAGTRAEQQQCQEDFTGEFGGG